jgi:hypothetical protein
LTLEAANLIGSASSPGSEQGGQDSLAKRYWPKQRVTENQDKNKIGSFLHLFTWKTSLHIFLKKKQEH